MQWLEIYWIKKLNREPFVNPQINVQADVSLNDASHLWLLRVFRLLIYVYLFAYTFFPSRLYK